jgi:hypothetical protein
VSDALRYLRETSDAMADAYTGDCLAYARTLAAMLDGAWLGRIRNVQQVGGQTFHAPLVPLRYLGRGGPAWTTHYVCVADGLAYDPIAGEPVPLAQYTERVFGQRLTVERVPF